MNRIQELLQQKRREVQERKKTASFTVPSDDRRIEWDRQTFHIFAEIKRASLSAGNIRANVTPSLLAKQYEKAGVSAISVLTEREYFHGSLEDLMQVRKTVRIPVLQKDFIVDEFQIYEAKAAGADFVLLIVRFLTGDQLKRLLTICEDIRVNAIVEIAGEEDLRRLEGDPRFLGVNSRDLRTLEIDVAKFAKLVNKLPDSFLIAESGINNTDALLRVIDLGYHGALIGEHFLRARDPEKEAALFVTSVSQHRRPKTRVKICGITNEADAITAVEAGADALGFVFADSPRKIDSPKLAEFRDRIPARVACVGVFKDQNREQVLELMRRFSLDIAQTYEALNLPGVIWRAINDLSFDERNTIIWDVKAERETLPRIWHELKAKAGHVFALAGGLDPQNVGEAISICHPVWVDVARGVEKEPGKKDITKVRSFIASVKMMNED